jgi:hypothetical protein
MLYIVDGYISNTSVASWSEFLATDPEVVALPSSGYGTGFTHVSLVRLSVELVEWNSSDSGSRKSRLTAVDIRCTDHATRCPQKLARTLPTSGGRSVGIVRAKVREFSL